MNNFNMFREDYSLFLQNNIKPFCRPASGGRVVNCRCFYCQDSKNMSHGHFYIKIPQSEYEPSVYYCQKCKAKGVVTPQKLIEWNIFDTNASLGLSTHNKTVFSNPQNLRTYTKGVHYKITNDHISADPLSDFKLRYINNRLGTNLSFKDCLDLKIVLNLNDILERNKLPYTRDPRIIEQLDSGFIGFLSHDNAFLNMRNLDIVNNINETINKRYINYNLVNQFDNTCRFYSVPTQIDLADKRPLQLHIAEGSFDILSIALNVRKTFDRCIYSAVGGSGYKGLINFFIHLLKIPNLEIHVYPDNDQSRYTMIDISTFLKPFNYPFYIHRNISPGEKDFGVSPDRIIEVIERVN